MGAIESNEELRDLIYSEVDDLRYYVDHKLYEWVVYEVCKWAGKTMNFSGRELLVEHRRAPAYVMYNEFAAKRKGAWCGAAACFFARVLSLFGIASFSYDYGMHKVGLSHQTTIPLYYQGGKVRSPVVDAYMGYAYENPVNMAWLDLPDLLSRIVEKRYGEIHISSWGSDRDVLLLEGEDLTPFSWLFPDGSPEPESQDGIMVYRGGHIDYETLFGGDMEHRARKFCGEGNYVLHTFYLDLMLHDIVLDPLTFPAAAYRQWKVLSDTIVALAEQAWKGRGWQA